MEKEYYWHLLEKVNTLESDMFQHSIPTQAETLNLKALAFAGLIRRGETFQIETNADEIEKIKAEQQKKIIAQNNVKIPDLVEVIKIRNMDNTIYSINLQVLKDNMKSDYDRFVTKISSKPTQTNYEELDIDLPDIFSDTAPLEEDLIPETPKPAKAPAKATKPANVRDDNYVPKLVGNIKYNVDPDRTKLLDTFCLNHVRMVYEEGNQSAVVDFNIFPLTFSENEPITDIMVIARSGSVIRAGISRGSSAAVKLEFDPLSFMIRGQWKDGDFCTQVNCLNPEFAAKFQQETTEYMPSSRTYTTYMQVDFGRVPYSFFPAIIGSNAASGQVPAAVVYEQDGILQILLTNEKDSFNMLDKDGLPIEVSLYWSGGQQSGKTPQLHLQIDDEV